MSDCGTCRITLTRTWDAALPVLLVCMLNPSDANHDVDDQTIVLVCHIAKHHGFGGIVVVNGIPLRDPQPKPAIAMTRWDRTSDWWARDRLQENLGVIAAEAARAGAVLVAWGANAAKCDTWFETVLEEIDSAVAEGTPVYCLGKTDGGHPIHPLARGKRKIPKNAPLVPWKP
jgi:hypothetical protein